MNLETNPVLYAGLIQIRKRGTAEILEETENGIFLLDTVSSGVKTTVSQCCCYTAVAISALVLMENPLDFLLFPGILIPFLVLHMVIEGRSWKLGNLKQKFQ